MANTSDRIESLFAAAAELPPESRQVFLDQQCAGDEALREQLDGLLRAHDRVNHALDRPAVPQAEPEATCASDSIPVGTIIAGRYKLLEQIGDGGMGTVWVAEQTEPVRRKVALKLIKAGMDSKAVLARFEAERQALAIMDHPNIAKVLDGGITEAGRPYFVMEYVKGAPITEYCDHVRLSISDRLDLFVQVCSAVQHAHQKGIIHRDLKPSNVLVAPYDDRPVPKVIDFGLAKALHQRLTERTLHTAHETVIGTPLYMSPEQAQLNNLDVDTRSDIYSLGVLLYELLTGTTPLEKARFKQAAWDEIRRIIRDEEPPRPSTRLSSTGTLPSLATSRQTEPVKLTQQLRGELDWIVMKALEKDRTRRYETATALSKDVQRYIAGEAVEACPPTLSYRFKKAYRKHRGAILTTSLVGCLLVVATTLSTWQAIRAQHAQREAETARSAFQRETEEKLRAMEDRESAFTALSDVLEQLNPHHRPTETPPSIVEVLTTACNDLKSRTKLTPQAQARVRGVFGKAFMSLLQYDEGLRQLWQAYEDLESLNGPNDLDTIGALEEYAKELIEGRQRTKDLNDAEKYLKDVHRRRAKVQGEDHRDTIEVLQVPLSRVLFLEGKWGELMKWKRYALELAIQNPDIGEDALLTARIRQGFAHLLLRSLKQNDQDEAVELCRKALRIFRREHGNDDPRTLRVEALTVFASHASMKDPQVAQEMKKLLGRAPSASIANGENREPLIHLYDYLAVSSIFSNQLPLLKEATDKLLELAPDFYGDDHPRTRRFQVFQAAYFVRSGDPEKAEGILRPLLASDNLKNQALIDSFDDLSRIHALSLYGECLLHKDFKEAEKSLTEAVYIHDDSLLGKKDYRTTREFREMLLQPLVRLYNEWGKPDQAAAWQKRIDELSLP